LSTRSARALEARGWSPRCDSIETSDAERVVRLPAPPVNDRAAAGGGQWSRGHVERRLAANRAGGAPLRSSPIAVLLRPALLSA
jgi:hypothetical protein